MESDFLRKKAREQAEKLEKEHGASAYGGTTWLDEQINGGTKWTDLQKKDKQEDIAPVRDDKTFWEKAQDWSTKYFATSQDLKLSFLQGVGGLWEGVSDFVLHGFANTADAFGADGVAEGMRSAANHDTVGAIKDFLMGDFKDKSALGDTARGYAQGLGNVAGIILAGDLLSAAGLGVAGTSALTTGTVFASSAGSGVSEAFNSGKDVTVAEATAYGLMSGAVEAGAEALFGGLGKAVKALGLSRGISSLDDVFAQKLSSKISNRFFKSLVQTGVKASAEGIEEMLAGYGSAVAKKLTYMSDADLKQLVEDENLLESFVIGALVSGTAQGVDFASSVKNDTDLISGLSKNEEAVVDKIYKDEVAEAEKNGKVSEREKTKIYDEIIERMEKGQISTDTIGEVLGGDSYKAYKATLDSENALTEELKSLQEEQKALEEELKPISKKMWRDMTGEEQDRREEIKARLPEIQTKLDEIQTKLNDPNAKAQRNALKAQLDKDTYELTKKDRLRESYFEVVRANQKYTADVSQYTGRAKKVIQQVMDSGLADNSNQTHEFWDMMANMANTMDTDITLANDEQILEMVKADYEAEGLEFDASQFEGQRIDGYISKNGIVLNAKSKRALNFVVGHEITHSLEGTKHYAKLQELLFEYAKDEYESRFNERSGQYANKFKADEKYKSKVDKEVTGDLVGDYIFNDKGFIEHLAKDRNVFQRVWDEVKAMAKIATAGSEQARQLEKVKREFERAYREANKAQKNAADGGVKFSLENGSKRHYNKRSRYSETETQFLRWENGSTPIGEVKKFVRYGKTHYYEKTENGCVELSRSQYNERNAAYVENIDGRAEREIGEAYDYDESTQRGTPRHSDGYRDTSGNAAVFGQAIREEFPDDTAGSVSSALGYDSRIDLNQSEYNHEASDDSGASFVTFSNDYAAIRNFMKDGDVSKDSGVQFSVSDSDGTQLSKEQSEFFRDSKVRDEDGNLKVMYHGTPNGDFTVFKDGTYFTPNKEYADKYQNPGASSLSTKQTASNPKTYEVYLDIKKPFDISDAEARRIYIEDYIKGGNAVGINPYLSDGEYAKIKTIDWTEGEDLREFLIDNGYDYDGLVLDEGATGGYGDEVKSRGTSYVVFSPEQVKNVDNKAPTSDPDIRFSLSESVEETKDLIAVHNLHSAELLETLNLSGLPSPSVAIIKAKDGHEKYGDVSLILPKDSIDPQTNKENRIYGSDAWTPTRGNAPVEYEVNYDTQRQFERTVEQLANNVANGIFSRSSILGMAGIEDSTSMNLKDIVDKISDYDAVRAAYVAENGGNVDVVYRTKVFDSYGNDALESYIGKVGEQEVARLVANILTGERLTADEIESAKDSMVESWVSKHEYTLKKKPELREGRIAKYRGSLSDIRVEDFVKHAWEFYEDSGATSDEIDRVATGDNLRASTNRSDVAAWVTEKLQGLLSEPAIYNGKDPFTPSGKRRSFKDMHWEYTAENIVRAMSNADARGANVWNVSGEAVIATATPEYKSINEVRADKDRLFNAEKGDYEKIKDEISNELQQVTTDIVRTTEHQSDNQYDEEQIIGRVIMEAAQGTKSLPGIKQVFKKNGYRIGDAQAKAVLALFDHASKVPTGYFEAKPQRVVGFDEVGVYVIPYDADVKLKQELLNRGYAIAEYDPKVEGDRTRVLNQFEKYKFSLSDAGQQHKNTGGYQYYSHIPDSDIAPVVENATTVENPVETVAENTQVDAEVPVATEEAEDIAPVKTTKEKLNEKLISRQTELEHLQKLRAETANYYDEKIAKEQALLDSKKNKQTKAAIRLKMRIERLQRLKADNDAKYAKRIQDITKSIDKTSVELEKDHTERDRYANAKARIERILESDKAALVEEYAGRKAEMESKVSDKNAYISNMARELYDELRGLRKGVRASENLGSLLDAGYDWGNLRSALSNVRYNPSERVNMSSAEESAVRQLIEESYENDVYSIDDLDLELSEKIHELETEADTKKKNARRATQRNIKQGEYAKQMEELIGDTTTWVDKKFGIQYEVNTLRRNLRDIVRDANGKRDIAKADAIYEELQGKYNTNEALLNRESNQIKKPYADMKLTKAEDAYVQMLGEFRHNPDTTITQEMVDEYYQKNKGKIDTAKVDKAIEMARQTYDTLLERVNEVLKEQGMKEIPYRKGYFPHFTDDKQGFLGKLFNWKVKSNEIPTDIAGLTEQFNPDRSWQSFNKQRNSDTTDYSFSKGLDTYVQGALDWIYHIEDIQKRRAFENHIRYVHSAKGVQEKIDAIRANQEYDADEMQEQIDLVLKEAGNPLNNFVTDFRTGTNTLAGKKSSMDRGLEQKTNRKFYSVMTNVSNRVSANMVAGSVSSALTNFIPIIQSWGEVSPVSSLRAMADTIRSTFRDDGTIDKSDFLTNRLKKSENLYKTGWDKVGEKVSFLMESVDSFAAQTVWRSKYLENISNGMSESEAIKNADQFAESVIAGRSRGNMPTIFDSKSPVAKLFTAFQLEVNNQYGYMFKDMPQDMKNESALKLAKGYATMFMGAYAYNALYSSLVGRDAAFDPIGIIEDLLRDMGLFDDDEEEEPVDTVMNFAENVLQEVPFVGGLLGGGRVPISSAMPYSGEYEGLEAFLNDISNKDFKAIGKELLNPVYYLAMPLGGGQLKKSIEGLSMFSDDHPISGSYTDSGKLRFPVEDTFGNRLQAGIFGQYASKNARDYFDNGRSPLAKNQIEEFMSSGMKIQDYWDYREGLSGLSKLSEKADYIDSLDLTTEQKNLLINNIADRKEDIDMSDYGDYDNFEEFDFATKNPEKYDFLTKIDVSYKDYASADDDTKDAYDWAFKNPEKLTLSKAVAGDVVTYRKYTGDLYDIKADKDSSGKSITGSRKEKVIDYINNMDLDYGQKIILFKSEYNSDNTYNYDILDYLNGRDDLTFDDRVTILKELGFNVDSKGNVTW